VSGTFWQGYVLIAIKAEGAIGVTACHVHAVNEQGLKIGDFFASVLSTKMRGVHLGGVPVSDWLRNSDLAHRNCDVLGGAWAFVPNETESFVSEDASPGVSNMMAARGGLRIL
jgi:hypothetical protein